MWLCPRTDTDNLRKFRGYVKISIEMKYEIIAAQKGRWLYGCLSDSCWFYYHGQLQTRNCWLILYKCECKSCDECPSGSLILIDFWVQTKPSHLWLLAEIPFKLTKKSTFDLTTAHALCFQFESIGQYHSHYDYEEHIYVCFNSTKIVSFTRCTMYAKLLVLVHIYCDYRSFSRRLVVCSHLLVVDYRLMVMSYSW